MSKTAAILDKAAQLIAIHGKLDGDYGDPDRGFCAMGAVNWVIWEERLGDDNDEANAIESLFEVVAEEDGPDQSIGYYNDTHTETEVIEALRRAARMVAA